VIHVRDANSCKARVPWLGPLYGSAYLGIALVVQVVVGWVMYYYARPGESGAAVLLPAGLVGIAMAVGRVVDALADPLVAVWSDNTRSRWGRRLPFMVIGAPFLALTFFLIWTPPGASELVTFIYLAIMLSLFFLFFTVFVAPYLALLPEIAPDPRRKVGYASWQAAFNVVGLAVAAFAGVIISLMGFRAMGLLLGAVALASFLAPVPALLKVQPRQVQQSPGLWESMRLTWTNIPYRWYLTSQVLFWFGFNMIMAVVPHITTVLMGQDEAVTTLVMGACLLVAAVSFPLVTLMARKYSARGAYLVTSGVFVVVLTAVFGIGYLPVGSPLLQGIVVVGAAGFPLAGMFILPNAIVAEITDLDHRRTGTRREAIYYGMQGLVTKAAIGLSSAVLGFVLTTWGQTLQQPLGIRLTGPIAGVSALLGLIAFYFYRPDGRPVPGPGARSAIPS